MRAGLLEFAILGVLAASVAVVLGTIGAWIVTTRVMDVGFQFAWTAVFEALVLALLLTGVLEYLSLRRTLNAPPVPFLRSE